MTDIPAIHDTALILEEIADFVYRPHDEQDEVCKVILSHVSDFVRSVVRQYKQGRQLSDRQVEAVIKAWDKIKDQAMKELSGEQVEVPPAPVGRVSFTGTIVHEKVGQNDYGTYVKILVVHDDGWKCWMSAPSYLKGLSCMVGDLRGIKADFSATLTHGNEKTFAFGKRPVAHNAYGSSIKDEYRQELEAKGWSFLS